MGPLESLKADAMHFTKAEGPRLSSVSPAAPACSNAQSSARRCFLAGVARCDAAKERAREIAYIDGCLLSNSRRTRPKSEPEAL